MTKRLPNLILIGAMKCGTSSIYAELNRHPDVYFPQNKEPNGLRAIMEQDHAAIEAYEALYRGRKERFLGDASTGYTKFPIRKSVAETAAQVLPSNTKIIYVTRDPLYRAERHVAHHVGNGATDLGILDVETNPEYAAISAYDMQLSFWRPHFDSANILQVDFEIYKRDRTQIVRQIFEFLELDTADSLEAEPISTNRGQDRRSAYRSPLRKFLHGSVYGALREALPRPIRRTLANILLPKALVTDFKFSEREAKFINIAVPALNQLTTPTEAEVRAILKNVRTSLAQDKVQAS